MQTLERLRERLRALVAVLERGIDYLAIRSRQFFRGKRQPPVPDILGDREAGQDMEHALEMIAGGQRRLRDILDLKRAGQMLLDIIDSLAKQVKRLH